VLVDAKGKSPRELLKRKKYTAEGKASRPHPKELEEFAEGGRRATQYPLKERRKERSMKGERRGEKLGEIWKWTPVNQAGRSSRAPSPYRQQGHRKEKGKFVTGKLRGGGRERKFKGQARKRGRKELSARERGGVVRG